jgi:hypothetical protein
MRLPVTVVRTRLPCPAPAAPPSGWPSASRPLLQTSVSPRLLRLQKKPRGGDSGRRNPGTRCTYAREHVPARRPTLCSAGTSPQRADDRLTTADCLCLGLIRSRMRRLSMTRICHGTPLIFAANSYRDLGHLYRHLGYILMNLVTRRRLKRLTVGDYDLGHLDTARGRMPPCPSRPVARRPRSATPANDRSGTSPLSVSGAPFFTTNVARPYGTEFRRDSAMPALLSGGQCWPSSCAGDALAGGDHASGRDHLRLARDSWRANTGTAAIRRAMCRFARCYVPDQGGTEAQMTAGSMPPTRRRGAPRKIIHLPGTPPPPRSRGNQVSR